MTFMIGNGKTINKNNSFMVSYKPQTIDKSVLVNHLRDSFITKLTGKNASTDMLVYSSQDPFTNGGTFVRNASCWLNGVTNISCFSPAQLSGSSWQQRAGTLISPRHALFAKHFKPAIISGGTPILFVDDNNNVVTRKIMGYADDFSDISIGLLDSDIPSNIKFAKVLPIHYTDYFNITSSNNLYIVGLDQEEKAIVKKPIAIQGYVDGSGGGINMPVLNTTNLSSNDPFFSFTETIVSGDSGNPVFFIIDNELVILTTWWTFNHGTFITTRYSEVNGLMNQLGGGYQLTPINLNSVYTKYR
jgi:hypothetical protein